VTGSGEGDGPDGSVGPVPVGRSTPGGKGSVFAARNAPAPAHARKAAVHTAGLTNRRI
jgi:hypothetical protein